MTRLTRALPDPRWNPKAFSGEVVPFRATVFREGHDLVGAMLVLTSPSGEVQQHRMSALAPGTDGWEARVRLDELGTWHWHVTGFGDEIGTWIHDAELKIDAGVAVPVSARVATTGTWNSKICPRLRVIAWPFRFISHGITIGFFGEPARPIVEASGMPISMCVA